MSPSIVWVPVAFFAFLAVVLSFPAWLRHRSRLAAIRMIGESAAQGHVIDPSVMQLLLAKPRPAVGKWFALVNLMLGVPELCIGIALSLSAGLLRSTFDPSLMVGARVNLCIGVGLIVLGLLSKRYLADRADGLKWDYAAVLALICFFLGTAGLSIGTALALSAGSFGTPYSVPNAGDMLTAALVNGCYGAGFMVLGGFILHGFVERGED